MICDSSFPKPIPAGRSERKEIHLNSGKMTAVPRDKSTAESLLCRLHRCQVQPALPLNASGNGRSPTSGRQRASRTQSHDQYDVGTFADRGSACDSRRPLLYTVTQEVVLVTFNRIKRFEMRAFKDTYRLGWFTWKPLRIRRRNSR